MPSRGPLTGSKRKARVLRFQERQRALVNRRLNEIMALAKHVQTEAHLEQLLANIPDDAMRAEVSKLIEPFLPFKINRLVQLADAPQPSEQPLVLAES